MESSAATIWLAIIAISSLMQALVIVGGAIAAYRVSTQMSKRLARLEREMLDPLARKISAVAEGAQDVVTRVQSADDNVREMLGRGTAAAADARQALQERMWPALGLTRGILAAVSSVVKRQGRTTSYRSRVVTPAQSVEGVPHAGI